MSATDKARVLARLEAGPLHPADFLLPNVCDGGKPILRVAARIKDLRDEGHDIVRPTALYVLKVSPDQAAQGHARARATADHPPAGGGDCGGDTPAVPSEPPVGDVRPLIPNIAQAGIQDALLAEFGPPLAAGRYSPYADEAA